MKKLFTGLVILMSLILAGTAFGGLSHVSGPWHVTTSCSTGTHMKAGTYISIGTYAAVGSYLTVADSVAVTGKSRFADNVTINDSLVVYWGVVDSGFDVNSAATFDGKVTCSDTIDLNSYILLPSTNIEGAGTGSGLDADKLDGIEWAAALDTIGDRAGDSASTYADVVRSEIRDTVNLVADVVRSEIRDTVNLVADVVRSEIRDTAALVASDTGDVLRAEMDDTALVYANAARVDIRDTVNLVADVVRSEIRDTVNLVADVVRSEIRDTVNLVADVVRAEIRDTSALVAGDTATALRGVMDDTALVYANAVNAAIRDTINIMLTEELSFTNLLTFGDASTDTVDFVGVGKFQAELDIGGGEALVKFVKIGSHCAIVLNTSADTFYVAADTSGF